jgi:hypothetical protein
MLNHARKSKVGSKPQAEYQINDRLSFREFSGLSVGDRVPDARSIWLFQNNLIKGIIGLINLVYNMCRYEQIVRLNLLPIKC